MVVDQLASIGALAVSVAREVGIDVAFVPGLAMRRIADLQASSRRGAELHASAATAPRRHCRL